MWRGKLLTWDFQRVAKEFSRLGSNHLVCEIRTPSKYAKMVIEEYRERLGVKFPGFTFVSRDGSDEDDDGYCYNTAIWMVLTGSFGGCYEPY